MTRTTNEILTVDGVVLNTLAKNVSSLAGRLRTPPLRTANVVVGQRHGEVRVPRKWYGPGYIVLPMWVLGCDDNGNIPSQSNARIEFFKRVDELTALFASPDLLTMQHTLPDGSVRECKAEVLEALDFSAAGINPRALFQVALNVPDSFWRDTADITQTFTNPTMSATLSLTNFAGATAPMDDWTVTITGPITNPKVEALRNGSPLATPVYFQYNGSIVAGQTLVVNCATWTIGGTGGGTYANLSHSGDARWLSVPPSPTAGAPQIRLSGTGNTSGTAIQVTGRRKFLVG